VGDSKPKWQQVLAHNETFVPPEPEFPVYDVPEDRAHDAREEEEWVHRLPEHAREDLREAWRTQEGEGRKQKKRRKETTKVYVVEAAIAFMALEVLLQAPSLLSLVAAGLFGAGAGGVAALFRSSAPSYGAVFTGFYVLLGLVAGSRHVAYYVLASLIVMCVGVALGRMHTLQKFDGTEL
jgi:hypothetical protein